jgi:hypothetical protein
MNRKTVRQDKARSVTWKVLIEAMVLLTTLRLFPSNYFVAILYLEIPIDPEFLSGSEKNAVFKMVFRNENVV